MCYAKLRGKIREVFGTQEAFALAMALDTSTISAKLNDNRDWTRREIQRACVALRIPVEEIHTYFFTPEIVKTQSYEGKS